MIETANYYKVADFSIKIAFKQSSNNPARLLSSMKPFREYILDRSASYLFEMTVDDNTTPIAKEHRNRIRRFDNGNGETIIDQIDDGGYQFIIKDINNKECALLITNKDFSDCKCALKGNFDMRCYGLNNALMLSFSFSSCRHEALLIHASVVKHRDKAFAFTAKSGTGKSTHVNLWLQNIENCELLNDDNPIIRIIGNKAFIYGSPWSGKTPCYRKIKESLGAVSLIERDTENYVEKLNTFEAFTMLITACSNMKWDKDIFNYVCNNISKLIETTNIYTVHCLPNDDAAIKCQQAIDR